MCISVLRNTAFFLLEVTYTYNSGSDSYTDCSYIFIFPSLFSIYLSLSVHQKPDILIHLLNIMYVNTHQPQHNIAGIKLIPECILDAIHIMNPQIRRIERWLTFLLKKLLHGLPDMLNTVYAWGYRWPMEVSKI